MNPTPGLESFYDLLGVGRDASRAQIRAAFLQRAQECHPDLNGQDEAAEIRFREIRFAYEVLHDKRKRVEYDQNPGRFHRQQQRSEWNRNSASTAGRSSARWEPSPHRFRSTRRVSTRMLAAVLGGFLAVFSLAAAAIVTLVLEGDHHKLLDLAHIRVAGETDSHATTAPANAPRISVDDLSAGPMTVGAIRVDDTVVAWRGSTSLDQVVTPIEATAPPLESISAAQSTTPLDPAGTPSRTASERVRGAAARVHGVAASSRADASSDRFGKQADAFLPRVQHSLWTGPGDSTRSTDPASSSLFFNPATTPAPLSPAESGAAVLASMATRLPVPSAEDWSVPVLPLDSSVARSVRSSELNAQEAASPWTSPVAWRETQAGVDWSHPLMGATPTNAALDGPATPLLSLQFLPDPSLSNQAAGPSGSDASPGWLAGLPGVFLPPPWSRGTPLVGEPSSADWPLPLPTFDNLWTRPSLASLGRIAGAAPRPTLRVPVNLPSGGLTLSRLQGTDPATSMASGLNPEKPLTESQQSTFARLRNTTPPLGSPLRTPPRQQDYSGVASRSMVRETPPGAAWINLRPNLPRTTNSLTNSGTLSSVSNPADSNINPTTGLAGINPGQPPRGLTHPGKWPPQPASPAPNRLTPGGPLTPSLRYSPTISSSSIYPPLYSF